jgi:multiple sugar transport system permease protein
MKRVNIKGIVLYLIIALVFVFFMAPYIWIGMTAFKSRREITSTPTLLFTPTLENFLIMINQWEFFKFFENSLIVTLISVPVSVAIGSLAAYAFSRWRTSAMQGLLLDILTIRMMPPIASALPLFVLASELKLLNTYTILILVYITFNLPLSVWIMKTFFDEIPKELDEAAMLDGCSIFGIFIKVIIPLSTPALVATTIICTIFTWNEFFFANLFTGYETKTLPILAASCIRQKAIEWGPAAAVALTVSFPILILALSVQKYLIRGLAFGVSTKR